MKRFIDSTLGAVAAVGLLCSLGTGGVAASTKVYVSPVASVVTVGGTFDLLVNISEVVDLYAFQFDITFDPMVITPTGIDEGAFLQTGGTTIFIPGAIDSTAGAISATAGSLIGPLSGVGGAGTLSTVHFHALILGVSSVRISAVSLLDSNLEDIPAAVVGGTVYVSAVPEPATLSLFGMGLLVLFGAGRRVRGASAISMLAR